MNTINLNNEIDYYIENYPDNAAVLKRIKDKINTINKQLNEDYSLVFMAEKGAGKTTTIGFLLGLTQRKQKTNEKTNRKYWIEEDILETGSGATTTSEVEICQSEDEVSKIVITPYNTEDVEDILNIFAKSMFSNIHKLEGDEEPLAPELIRACRNMTALTERQNDLGEKIDHLRALALEFDSSDYESFRQAVIERAHVSDRKKIEFICDTSKEKEKSWIKKLFRRINLVHIDDAPLPKKITVKLSKDIFDFSKLNKINNIIDTRGLEIGSNTDRSDIKSVFRDGTNNILLFVDKFNSPSKSIIDLLDHYVYDKDMDVIDRLGYIVNYRDGEAEKVVGCHGVIESAEDGIMEKRNQVIQIFRENGVFVKDNNIIYCNPKKHLDREGKIEISVEELEEYDYDKAAIETFKKEEREDERIRFVDDVISFIDDYEEKLQSDLEEAMNSYNSIKDEIEKNANIDVEPIIDKLNKKEIQVTLKDKIAGIFDEYIVDKFPSTLRAINNRFGIFNSYDIYCEGANVVESLLKKTLQKIKDDVIYELDILSETKRLNVNQEKAKEYLKKDINRYFFNYIQELNAYYYSKLTSDTFSKETNKCFWERVIARWGKGSGYRNDIMEYYKEHLKVNKINEEATSENERIINEFKKGIIDILNNVEIPDLE